MYRLKETIGDWEEKVKQKLIFEWCPNPKCIRTRRFYYIHNMVRPACTDCNTPLKGAAFNLSSYARIDYHQGLRGLAQLDNGDRK